MVPSPEFPESLAPVSGPGTVHVGRATKERKSATPHSIVVFFMVFRMGKVGRVKRARKSFSIQKVFIAKNVFTTDESIDRTVR